MKLFIKAFLTIIAFSLFNKVNAQTFDQVMSKGEIRGNFQFDSQFYQEDTVIGAQKVDEKNSF